MPLSKVTLTVCFNPALCSQEYEELPGLSCLGYGNAFMFLCVSKSLADVAFFICKILGHCFPVNLCIYQVGPDGKNSK